MDLVTIRKPKINLFNHVMIKHYKLLINFPLLFYSAESSVFWFLYIVKRKTHDLICCLSTAMSCYFIRIILRSELIHFSTDHIETFECSEECKYFSGLHSAWFW